MTTGAVLTLTASLLSCLWGGGGGGADSRVVDLNNAASGDEWRFCGRDGRLGMSSVNISSFVELFGTGFFRMGVLAQERACH